MVYFRIFYLIFLEHGCLQRPASFENEAVDEGEIL